jgi:hypothetical protein
MKRYWHSEAHFPPRSNMLPQSAVQYIAHGTPRNVEALGQFFLRELAGPVELSELEHFFNLSERTCRLVEIGMAAGKEGGRGRLPMARFATLQRIPCRRWRCDRWSAQGHLRVDEPEDDNALQPYPE